MRVKSVCKIIDKSIYATLDAALGAAIDGDTVQLISDIEYNTGISISEKSITFDLNGCTLSVINASGTGLEVGSGGIVSLIGEGAFNIAGSVHGVYAHDGGMAVVTNATVTGAGGTGVFAQGGGAVTAIGDATGNTYGVSAVGAGSFVEVFGNAVATGSNGTGASAQNGATIAVNESVRGTFCGAEALNGGEVSVGDITATGQIGKSTYGAFVSGSGSSVTANGNITAVGIDGMPSFGVYVSDSGSLVTVGGSIIAAGAGGFGVQALSGGTAAVGGDVQGAACSANAAGSGSFVTVDGNATVTDVTGVAALAQNDGAVTVGGSVIASGASSTGASAEGGATVTIYGSINAPVYVSVQGTNKTAAEGASQIINDETYFTYSDGVSAVCVKAVCQIIGKSIYTTLDAALIDAADGDTVRLLGDFVYRSGISISGKSITFDLNGCALSVTNISGAGLNVESGGVFSLIGEGAFNVTGTTYGVIAQNGNSRATVTNALATGTQGIGAYAFLGGTVTVTGNAASTGSGGSGGKSHMGGTLAVSGDATATGANGNGAYAYYGTVTVSGNATATGTYSRGAIIFAGGTVTIGGDASGTGYGAVSDSFSPSETAITIGGNAVGTGIYGIGAIVNGAQAMIAVGKDVDAKGYYGIEASDGGTVTVGGNIILYNAESSGVMMNESGATVTVEGTINVSDYLYIWGTSTRLTAADGIAGESPYEDYLIYSSAPSTVRVRIPVAPSIDKDAVTLTRGDTGSFVVNLGAGSAAASSATVVSGNTAVAKADKASVAADGESVTISAVSQGTAIITITFNDAEATVKTIAVTVNNPSSDDDAPTGVIYSSDIDFSANPVIVLLTGGRNIISGSALKLLAQSNRTKPVIIQGSDYQFTFPVGTMKELPSQASCQFGVLVNGGNSDIAGEILKHTYGGSDNIIIRFSRDGELPTKDRAEIRFRVGAEYAGMTFYYYYYNPTADTLEFLQSAAADDGGWITVKQSHCSDYLLTSKKLSPNDVIIKENPEAGNHCFVPYYTEGDRETIVKFSAMIGGETHFIGDASHKYLFKDNTKSFTDIGGHWAEDEIDFVAVRELFGGTGGGRFSPDASLTRGMAVTVLGRLWGADTGSFTASRFTDVSRDAWYAPYVEWAAENGIVNGIGSGRFAPDRAVTRDELSVITANFIKFTGFTLNEVIEGPAAFDDDSGISTWAKDSVTAMQKAGIISGKGNNIFDPKGTATRAETAVILKRLITNIVQ